MWKLDCLLLNEINSLYQISFSSKLVFVFRYLLHIEPIYLLFSFVVNCVVLLFYFRKNLSRNSENKTPLFYSVFLLLHFHSKTLELKVRYQWSLNIYFFFFFFFFWCPIFKYRSNFFVCLSSNFLKLLKNVYVCLLSKVLFWKLFSGRFLRPNKRQKITSFVSKACVFRFWNA